MEKLLKSVIATLSFLFAVLFCLSGDIEVKQNNTKRLPHPPIIKNVEFQQVPAIVNIGTKDEKQFNWEDPVRSR